MITASGGDTFHNCVPTSQFELPHCPKSNYTPSSSHTFHPYFYFEEKKHLLTTIINYIKNEYNSLYSHISY